MVFVYNEAGNVSRIGFSNGMTLRDAISLAGGLSKYADKRRIEFRQVKGPIRFLTAAEIESEGSQIKLRPADVIIVHRRNSRILNLSE